MIEPTVGRIVWVRYSGRETPLAGIITSVISNTKITVTVFELDCEKHMMMTLYQGDTRPSQETPYAEWMPYQKGQAAKTEALEKQLKPNTITYEKGYGPGDGQTYVLKD